MSPILSPTSTSLVSHNSFFSLMHELELIVHMAYPERPPLSILKHSKHTMIQLHRAVKLRQIVIVDLLELQRQEGRQDMRSVKPPHTVKKTPTARVSLYLTALSSIIWVSLKFPSECFSSFRITIWKVTPSNPGVQCRRKKQDQLRTTLRCCL